MTKFFVLFLMFTLDETKKNVRESGKKSLSGNNFFFNGQKSKVLEREAEMEGGIERTKKPFLLKLSLSLSLTIFLSYSIFLYLSHIHTHTLTFSLSQFISLLQLILLFPIFFQRLFLFNLDEKMSNKY